MRIHKIQLKNLNSLNTEVVLNFDEGPLAHTGLFAITGDTGAGKSTILDALTLALFGQTSRDHDKEVMSNGENEAQAEVTFSNENGLFLARWIQKRTKSKDQPLKTTRELARWDHTGWITLETGRRVDSTKSEKGAVENVLGLNYAQFKRTVLLAQGEFAAFLKADEKDRAAVLERLTNTELYSRLSKAAHLKAAEERAALQQLQLQRQAIAVLQTDELEQLKTQLFALEAKGNTLAEERHSLQANLHWLDQLEALEKRMTVLSAEEAELASSRLAFEGEFARLTKHRQTRPLQQECYQLEQLELEWKQQSALLQELLQVEEREKQHEAEWGLAVATLREETTRAAQELEGLEAILEKVAALDGQIARQDKFVKELDWEVNVLTEKFSDARTDLDKSLQQKEQVSRALAECTRWLKENQADATLAKDLPLIEKAHVPRVIQLEMQIAEAEEKLHLLEQEQRSMAEVLQNATAQADQSGKSLHTLRNDLAQHLQNSALPPNLQEALAETERRIQQSENTLRNLQEFTLYQSEYRRIAQDLNALREDQARLLVEDHAVGKDLLNLLDQMAELTDKVHVKRRRYESEQLKNNYLRDRATLKEGEPCPLCGSEHHPWATHPIPAFVDDARQELALAEKNLLTVQHQHAALIARKSELHDRLGTAYEDLDDVVNTQTRQLVDRLNEYEVKIKGILATLDTPPDALDARETFFQEKIKIYQQQQFLQKNQREKTLALSEKMRQLERDFQVAEHKKDTLAANLKALNASVLQQKEYVSQHRQTFEKELEVLAERLGVYGLQWSGAVGESTLVAGLKQRLQRFAEVENQYQKAAQMDKVLDAEIAIRQQQVKEDGTLLDSKIERRNVEKLALQKDQHDRYQLFGDKDPREERLKAHAQYENLAQRMETQQKALQEQQKITADASARCRQTELWLQQQHTKIQTLENSLQTQAVNIGFESLEAMKAAVLAPAVADQLEQKAAALSSQTVELAQSRRELEKALAAEKSKSFPYTDKTLASAQAGHIEQLLQEVQREIGGLHRLLQENETRSEQVAELLVKIAAQQTTYNRWEKLRELIGAHDGSAFRKYAQSLTLQQLIQHANRHLERLQGGRYRLHKRAGADLEMEIVDTYQADFVRSISTLSGGETFLASLALALGLADMAGKRTRIQSLFIDEGFGALDENALELAITTLETLQAQGATIGIISHLRELKERISTQVQVVRGSDGFSDVKVV